MSTKKGIREIEQDSFENYRQSYPKDYPLATFKDVLEKLVESIPDRTSFIQGKRSYTWKQFDDRTNKIANFLLDLGLKKGDRVGINGFNSIEWMEVFFGAAKVGFAPVNLNPRYTGDELKYVLEDSDCAVLFTEDRWIDIVHSIRQSLPLLRKVVVYNAPGYTKKEVPADSLYESYENIMEMQPDKKPKLEWEIGNDDLSYFKYTGGTTGYPKGVVFDNWRGCGGMKWGMISTAFDSGWEKLASSPVIKGLVDLVASQNPDLDVSDPSVLKSRKVKELVLTQLPSIFGQPWFYQLMGGTRSVLYVVPLFHGLGFNNNMMYICTQGATSIYLEPAHPFNAKLFWEAVETHRPFATAIAGDAFAVPLIEELERAEKEGRVYDASSLTTMTSSGVRFSAHLKRKLLDRLPWCTIADGYGIAEGVAGFTYSSTATDENISEHTTPETSGIGFSAKRLVLCLDSGKPAEPGCQKAELLYTGPFIGLGYWKAPELTRRTYVKIGGELYVRTGDEGFVDENGRFHLRGRGGGWVINTGGEKVYSEEVEEVIKSFPTVVDAAVVGLPDERWGEIVAALVELRPGAQATQDELKQYCRSKLAGYKIPKIIVFQRVPRKDTGKLEREKVIELFAKQADQNEQ